MTLQSIVDQVPVSNMDYINRNYNSLNIDYKVLHSLCSFFLENKGLSYSYGDSNMILFMVNMGRLYERFVAEWLKHHLPYNLEIRSQESIVIGEENEISFDIDIVLYNSIDRKIRAVIDTKYKNSDHISKNDINQIVTYAEIKGCDIGILLYPEKIDIPIQYTIGKKKIYVMGFDITGNFEDG